jgi:hypothetical protein
VIIASAVLDMQQKKPFGIMPQPEWLTAHPEDAQQKRVQAHKLGKGKSSGNQFIRQPVLISRGRVVRKDHLTVLPHSPWAASTLGVPTFMWAYCAMTMLHCGISKHPAASPPIAARFDDQIDMMSNNV